MIENIKKEIDILSKKHFDFWKEINSGVRSKTDVDLSEFKYLSENLNRLQYDVESMIKTRGIVRRYFPGTKK